MTASKIVIPNTWADFAFGFDFAFGLPRLLLLLPFFTAFCIVLRSFAVAVAASDTNSTSDDEDDEDDDEDDDDSDVGGVNGVICGFKSIESEEKTSKRSSFTCGARIIAGKQWNG